jgi:hypothetical protein
MSDVEAHKQAMRSSIELPPVYSNNIEPTSEPFSHLNTHRRRELLPSILATSPPGRSSTLPPIQRNPTPNRPRKQSLSKRAKEPQHKRQKSRGEQPHLRRMSYDRKAYSAEPSSALSAAYGKRWEDLIDAATSATEDVNEDRTPVGFSTIPHCFYCLSLRFLHLPYPSTVYQCPRSLLPISRDTKRHHCNKLLHHHHTYRKLLNHFPPSRVERVVITSILNLVVFLTLPQASRPWVYRYTVLLVKEYRY